MKELTRRERIVVLLDHYRDFFDPDGTTSERGEARGTDAGIALLPLMSRHPSVVELCRVLGLLEQMGPRHYKHLVGFYGAEWRNVDAVVYRKTRSGRRTLVLPPPRQRERIVPRWVDVGLVGRGVDFLLGVWSAPLFLPDEINPEERKVAA